MPLQGRTVGGHVTNLVVAAAEEELSEEDQQLKGELDMMVERLTVRIGPFPNTGVAQTDLCRNQTRSSTRPPSRQ